MTFDATLTMPYPPIHIIPKVSSSLPDQTSKSDGAFAIMLAICTWSEEASLTPIILSISDSLRVVSAVMFKEVREGTLYKIPGRFEDSAIALKC